MSPHRRAYTYSPLIPALNPRKVIRFASIWDDLGQKWGGHVHPSLPRGDAPARGPHSGPTPDPLSLCQNDINLIVTCFNAVIKIALKF